jgi:hypothetical protein
MLEIGQEWLLYITPFRMKETTAPSGGEILPNAISLYAKDKSGTSALYFMNDAGTESEIPSGTIVTGSGVANRLAFWSGTSTLSSDADLTFVTDTLTATKLVVPTSATFSFLTTPRIPYASTAGLLADSNGLNWDNTNKDLLVGILTTNPISGFRGRGLLVGKDAGSPEYEVYSAGTAGFSGVMRFIQARGTMASPTPSQSSDAAGLAFNGCTANGTIDTTAAARIVIACSENWSSTAEGTLINFDTTPNGSTAASRATRFQVGPSGQWGIGGATYGTANNIYKSGGASAAPSWGTVNILDSDSHGDTLTGTVVRGDLIIGNSTPKWSRLARGTSGAFIRNDGSDVQWSTLILPNAATANRIVYATSSNTLGESANLTYDGTDFGLGSGTRARMQSQNRFRYLNCVVFAVSSGQTNINNATWTSLALASENFDTDTMHDNSTNNSRITIRLTGKYFVVGTSDFSAAVGGSRLLRVYQNGTTDVGNSLGPPPTAGNNLPCLVHTLVTLTANDYIELQAYQDSGGTLTNHNSLTTQFGAYYVGE